MVRCKQQLAAAMPAVETLSPWHIREQRVAFTPENPKKQKTKSWDKYEKYKSARTIGEARDAGASTRDLAFDEQRGYLTLVKDEESDENIEQQQGEDIDQPPQQVAEMPDQQMFDPGEPRKQADAELVWKTMWMWHIRRNKRTELLLQRERRRSLWLARQLQDARVHLSICKGYVRWGRDPLRMMLSRSKLREF